MATALHSARTRFFDKCGNPLCGGTVYTYQVGSTTYKQTYTDVNKSAVNTNPVILDSIGSAAIFLDGAYRVRVLDRNGVLVEDIAYVESWIAATEKDALDTSIEDVIGSLSSHVAKNDNPHGVTKAHLGLGNVDNTADLDKPISNTVNSALLAKSDKADTYTKSETDNKITALSSTTYAGHKGYATLADAQAAQASLAVNTIVEVTNDTDSTKNGVYLWNGTTLTKSNNDVLGQAKSYTDTLKTDIKTNSKNYTQTVFDSTTANKLDPNTVLNGYEIYSDGRILAEPNSVTTNLIDVSNITSITVSGLQPNPQIGRYYHFLDAANNVLLKSDIGLATEKTINVPAGAVWFRMSLKQRNPNPLDISTAQIEYGNSNTNYAAFSQGDIVGLQGRHLKQNISSLTYAANGKNIFDKSTVMQGYEVYADGKVVQQPDSITTAPIDVSNLSNITISGLVQNPEIGRYVVFKDRNNTILLVTQIERTATVATLVIPTNAKTMQLSIKQRSSSIPNLNVVQIESGINATAYEDYTLGVAGINGLDIVKPSISTTKQSRAFGAKYLMFGDSITETSNVEQDVYTDTSYRSNWPKFAKDVLQMSDLKNYAKSGASFKEYSGQLTWQKISHQVNTAIANKENPNIIVLACGTNDGTTNLGDYTTAMSKDIASLDMSITAEAMRWSLYQIRKNFPNATCFYSTQLQRADVETEDRKIANDLMVKLAKRYGFYVIDSMYESGIVRDFEVWQANGRYLSDGLHPNVAGQQVQANYIVSQIIERMTY